MPTLEAFVLGFVSLLLVGTLFSLEPGGWLRQRLPRIAKRIRWQDDEPWEARSKARRILLAAMAIAIVALLFVTRR